MNSIQSKPPSSMFKTSKQGGLPRCLTVYTRGALAKILEAQFGLNMTYLSCNSNFLPLNPYLELTTSGYLLKLSVRFAESAIAIRRLPSLKGDQKFSHCA